jgi:uncharacterized membrane protein
MLSKRPASLVKYTLKGIIYGGVIGILCGAALGVLAGSLFIMTNNVPALTPSMYTMLMHNISLGASLCCVMMASLGGITAFLLFFAHVKKAPVKASKPEITDSNRLSFAREVKVMHVQTLSQQSSERMLIMLEEKQIIN